MTASGTIGLYPKFRADDADGLPLEGGRLYSFLSGTSTPQAMYADAELTTAMPNPIILDASGEALFYSNGQPLKWILRDAQDVLQWEIDPVTGTGAGSAAAGVGWGKNTVRLQPVSGAAQASTVLFPEGVLALAVTVWCSQTCGTSQGLTQLGVGSPDLPDCWGVIPVMTLEDASDAGVFLAYGGQPMPQSGVVTLTAYGGLFDGAGELYVTGHFLTCTPGHEEGYLYLPSPPASGQILPPLPVASETVAGIVELADPTESSGETNDTRAMTPLKVAQRLAAKLPPGGGFSVARYTAAGTALEAAPLTSAVSGNLGLRVQAPEVGLHLTAENITDANVLSELWADSTAGPALSGRKARGTRAAPVRVLGGDILLAHQGTAWTRNAGDTADAYLPAVRLRAEVDSVDAQGRMGSRLTLALSPGVSAAQVEVLRVTEGGNLLLGITTSGTSATRTLTLGAGVLPTTSPPDSVQMTVADRAGTAGKGSLHLRTEDGTSHVLGDRVGIGTLATSPDLGGATAYQPLTVNGNVLLVGQSSLQERAQTLLTSTWVTSTDATRTARLALFAYDATAAREGLRIEASGTVPRIGFLGANASARITLPVAATDPATTMSLANAIRTALITLGLGA